jgi:hypothetical protein
MRLLLVAFIVRRAGLRFFIQALNGRSEYCPLLLLFIFFVWEWELIVSVLVQSSRAMESRDLSLVEFVWLCSLG